MKTILSLLLLAGLLTALPFTTHAQDPIPNSASPASPDTSHLTPDTNLLPAPIQIGMAIVAFLTALVGLARIIVKLTPTPDDDTKLEKFVEFLKHIGLHIGCWPFYFLISALCFFSSGCAPLDPAGVYHGDQVLHKAELTITTSYDVIHTYVTWEKENRAALAAYPEIKTSAEVMRAGAKQWFATANALHDAYAASPTPENRDALATALAVLQTALDEAVKYMAQAAAAPAGGASANVTGAASASLVN